MPTISPNNLSHGDDRPHSRATNNDRDTFHDEQSMMSFAPIPLMGRKIRNKQNKGQSVSSIGDESNSVKSKSPRNNAYTQEELNTFQKSRFYEDAQQRSSDGGFISLQTGNFNREESPTP